MSGDLMVLRKRLCDFHHAAAALRVVGIARGGQGGRVGGRLELGPHHVHVADIHGEGDHPEHYDEQHRGQDRDDASAQFSTVLRLSVS